MTPPQWMAFYIDPEQPNSGLWRQTGTYWTPENITATEALSKLLPRHYDRPLWAFAHAMPSGSAWYDLHYPEGVERKTAPPDVPLGPHFWVPGQPT
jgi:hypothetical protein